MSDVTEEELRSGVRELCARFPDEYWRQIDRDEAYPQDFVEALTEAGWLAALIPAEYGGAGLGISEAAIIMEEINRSGANGGACHAQMYIMGTVLRHGSDEQKQRMASADRRWRAATSSLRRHRARRRPGHDSASALARGAAVTPTPSTGKRSGPRVRFRATSCSCSPVRQ